jgi:hypothetical protein
MKQARKYNDYTNKDTIMLKIVTLKITFTFINIVIGMII